MYSSICVNVHIQLNSTILLGKTVKKIYTIKYHYLTNDITILNLLK